MLDSKMKTGQMPKCMIELYYLKANSTVYIFIPLQDKTINHILQKACGLSTEPVVYPVIHVVRCKTMCTNVFLQISKKKWNFSRGEI